MLDGDRFLDPRQLEKLATSELFLPDGHALGRSTSHDTLQVARLRFQPCVDEVGRILGEGLQEHFLHMGVVQRLGEEGDLSGRNISIRMPQPVIEKHTSSSSL